MKSLIGVRMQTTGEGVVCALLCPIYSYDVIVHVCNPLVNQMQFVLT